MIRLLIAIALTLFLTQLLVQPVAHADQASLLIHAEDAYLARIKLIENSVQAKVKTLDLAYWMITSDKYASVILNRILYAAQNGVKVRILIDSPQVKIHDIILGILMIHNVEIRQFNTSPPFRFPTFNKRMHQKLMVSGNSEYILGGRNIGETYFATEGARLHNDKDVWIKGESSKQAHQVFEKLWSHAMSKSFDSPDLQYILYYRNNLNKLLSHSKFKKYYDQITIDSFKRTELVKQKLQLKKFQFVKINKTPQIFSDTVESKKAKISSVSPIVEAISNAKQFVLIENPYVILTPSIEGAILSARKRGVEVVILTNSENSTDNMFAIEAYKKNIPALLNLGVRLFEYMDKETIHAKMAVVDDKLIVLGSYNLDPRSEFLDSEMVAVFESQELANQIYDDIEEKLLKCDMITKEGRVLNPSNVHYERNKGFWKNALIKGFIRPFGGLFRKYTVSVH